MIITLLTGTTSKLKEKIQKEFGLEVKIIRSSRSNKLTLKIDTKTQIPTISMPKLCSNKRAFEFVESNISWIQEKLSQTIKQKKFEDAEKILFFGQELIIKHCPEMRAGVIIEDGLLRVSGKEEFLHRRVKDFIKNQAKKTFSTMSKQQAEKLGYKINNIVIKDTKSRWGSCSSNNNINYNWRIALAPYFVIEYLICHEVSHLKHQDHSKDFWSCVKGLCPNYLQGKNWLKNHSKELLKYE